MNEGGATPGRKRVKLSWNDTSSSSRHDRRKGTRSAERVGMSLPVARTESDTLHQERDQLALPSDTDLREQIAAMHANRRPLDSQLVATLIQISAFHKQVGQPGFS